MLWRDARRQHILMMLEKFAGDFQHLPRRLASAKNHLGKPFAQCAMRIHLREPDVRNRRRLERFQHLVTPHAARAEFFQELSRFSNCHAPTVPQKPPPVTNESLFDQSKSRKTMAVSFNDDA